MASETQKLDFGSAMGDFKNMFPHLDNKLIEKVLRSNNGMVDQTIDDLLAISCEDTEVVTNDNNDAPSAAILETQSNLLRPIEHQSTGSTGGSTQYPTLSAHLPPGDLTLTPRHLQPPRKKYGQVPISFLGTQYPIPFTDPLPPQFLRLSEPVAPPVNSQLASQMAEDREFALLLHNEEFLMQARNNQEFMRTLNQAERAGLFAGGASDTVNESGASGTTEDAVSISQRLSETGKATRSKLLKIAKKLNWRKAPVLSSKIGSSKLREPLLGEDAQPKEEFLDDEERMFIEMEEEDEELKTIPRQNTINNFQQEHLRAREAVARQMRGERPPPPPVPPPQPRTTSTLPPSNSMLSSHESASSSSGTLTNTLTYQTTRVQDPPPLLDLDPTYENAGDTETPVYASDVGSTTSDNVSKLSMTMMSDTSSLFGPDCDVNREIHSATLSSSYLIPIRTNFNSGSEEAEGEQLYDNLVPNRPRPTVDNNLIKF